MDGFTHQQHSFLIDDPNLVPPNNTSMFSQFYPHQSYDERTNMNFIDNSSLVADYKHENFGDQVITTGVITHNMRKNKGRDGNSSTSSQQLKEGKEVQSKKQRKRNSVMKDSEENKAENDENNNKKLLKEAPAGFIHVRARRGQATDSHSLAERVRREKISERMKVLQALVPGCDKVTGKALMLEEIINYVQSLQYQVEFLSLKIASLNPNFYDLGLDMDALMMTPDLQNLANYSLDV